MIIDNLLIFLKETFLLIMRGKDFHGLTIMTRRTNKTINQKLDFRVFQSRLMIDQKQS